MSRVGKQPVPLPSGVAVEQKDGEVHVKGPKGSVSGTLPRGVTMEIGDAEVRFVRAGDDKPSRALHGLARGLVANMAFQLTVRQAGELSSENVRLSLESGHSPWCSNMSANSQKRT